MIGVFRGWNSLKNEKHKIINGVDKIVEVYFGDSTRKKPL